MARILIVDDESAVRRFIRKVLERAGHEVVEAEEGNAALRLQRESRADLVVTDILMPGMEGIEMIQSLREQDPEVSILAMSGAGRVDMEGRLLDAELLGADASLQKPFTPDELRETVERLLNARAG